MKSAHILTLAVMLAALLLPAASCQDIAPPLENLNWVLIQYGTLQEPKTPLADTQITAYFDGKTKSVTGQTGCNSYRANYTVDGLGLNIRQPVTMTKVFCGGAKGIQEKEYISQLQFAATFEMDRGQLILKSGANRLRFKQTDKPVKTVTEWGE
jgi:heat shock protein HslJ